MCLHVGIFLIHYIYIPVRGTGFVSEQLCRLTIIMIKRYGNLKNVKVGKKIFLGFGAVILLIVIILGVTVVTSLDRNNQLSRITTMSHMEKESNALLDEFNSARIELRTVFTASQANAEYEKAMEYLAASQSRLVTINSYVDELGNYPAAAAYRENAAQIDSLFNDLIPKVDQIHQNDLVVTENSDILAVSAQEMAQKSTELLGLITNLTMSTALEDGQATKDRLNNVLLPTIDLSADIDGLRAKGAHLVIGQDVSVYPDVQTMLEDIATEANAISGLLVTEAGKNAINAVISAIANYETAAAAVVESINNSAELTTQARSINDELANVVNASVDNLSIEVDSMITSLTNTSITVMIIMLVVVIIAIVFSALVAVYIGKAITRPLGKMHQILVQVGKTGDLHFAEDTRTDLLKEAQAKDELGQSIGAFAGFIDRISYIGEALETVAARDLTVEVALLSPEDTMGNALTDMLANLNEMFAEINSISSQVATASNEIAQGAQSLAQGSTQQASTVQEISASINEINEQANVSSETASEAARQGNEISRIAQEGSQKMSHMMESVQQINDASQSIGRVIKVIDDIAFQTNILALNAAVEAARAGEHGKGFAVVADEVRNLAGKSADAAKETANLISANIEKAELGLSISRDTAESLSQIMQGIDKTSDSLQDLADQSAGAKAATAQVNLAVDQVAQVVQQNSATSEQSAAASEEMSSQAQVLEQLIARFKLKSNAHASIAVSSSMNMGTDAPQFHTSDQYALPATSGNDIIF